MNQQKAIRLLNNYKNGQLSPEQERRLNQWYLSQAAQSTHELSERQTEQTVELIRSRLPGLKPPRTARLWLSIAAVAACMALVFLGLYYFMYQVPSGEVKNSLAGNEVLPGKAGATLTLSSGKKISLLSSANGKIASQAGVTVSKTANGELIYQPTGGPEPSQAGAVNTLTTANGQTYVLTLPDHSKIWINSASSISYPVDIARSSTRVVKMRGEAYFQVAKDKTRPFVVQTGDQQVEVLGTHFNINSYPNEPNTTTTLLEGSVRVTAGKNTVVIKPGQQAINHNTSLAVTTVNSDSVTDWKEGDFYLNHVDFKTAMRKIARWYDVEVIYDPSFSQDMESGGWISRNNKLSAVLKLIESSGQVHFKVQGKKIFVSNSLNH
jgi:transmembrane sensor